MEPTPTRTWLSRLDLRLDPRLILWGGATLAMSLLVGMGLAAALTWRDGRADAEKEVRHLVRPLAQHAARTIEPVDRALMNLQRALEQEGFGRAPVARERLNELLRARAEVGRQLQRLSIVDAEGNIVAVSDQPVIEPGMRVEDPGLAQLAGVAVPGLIVREPRTSRFVPMRVVPVARTLSDARTQRLLGVVVGAIDAAELEAFHGSFGLGTAWHLDLLRSDGLSLASQRPTRPWVRWIGSLPADAEESVTWHEEAGVEWVTGLHRVGAWPLVAAVAVRADTIVTPWRQHAVAGASIAVPAALALMGLAWLGAVAARRARGLSHTLGIAEARYRSLVESSPDGILLARDGRIDFANEAMLELAGAESGGALVGRRVDEFLDGVGDYHRSAEFDGPPQPTVVRIEHTLRPLGGVQRDVETLMAAAPRSGHGEGDTGLQIVVRDISARKAAERALRESAERHRLMVEGAPDCAFLLLGRDGHIESVGASAQAGVLGPPPQWCGQSLAALLDEATEGLAQRLLAKAAGAAGRAEHEGWCKRANGERFWGELVVSALHHEPGVLRGYHVQVRDTSARRRLLRELEASRRDVENLAMAAENSREREKRRIARELHDELGQVLTVQQLELEMLSAEAAGRWPELMPRLEGLHARVDDAIAVTRRISGDLRPLVLDDLGLVAALEWLVGQLGSRAGLQGRLRIQGDPTRISDEVATTLFRIAQESVTNVMRHAEARQVLIELTIERAAGGNGHRAEGDEAAVPAAEAATPAAAEFAADGAEPFKGSACLTVTDDGRGIDQGRARRRGLGLRGIEERVRLLGGHFELAAAAGGGTCVRVRLPLSVTPADAVDAAAPDPMP